MMKVTTFWCASGGVGKTTRALEFVDTMLSAGKRVLVLDLSPHCALSLNFKVAIRKSIGDYFNFRLTQPFSVGEFAGSDYVTYVRENLDIICGDISMDHDISSSVVLSRMNIPGVDTRLAVVSWVKDLLDPLDYDHVVIDCGSEFTLWVENALVASDTLIYPSKLGSHVYRSDAWLRRFEKSVPSIKLPDKVGILSDIGGTVWVGGIYHL